MPFLPSVSSEHSIEALSLVADDLSRNQIAMTPWPAYQYKPDVSFSIAHGVNCILLKYFVAEKNIRAVYNNANDPVCKDSCVEIFISFGNEPEYYNFEFNCIGTCHLGYGQRREGRKLLPATVIKKINIQSVIRTNNNLKVGDISWQLTVMIPLEVFYFHTFTSLKNQHCKVNFYKCGDELPEPHFLAWNNIKAEKPDFHLSEYFGHMKFL